MYYYMLHTLFEVGSRCEFISGNRLCTKEIVRLSLLQAMKSYLLLLAFCFLLCVNIRQWIMRCWHQGWTYLRLKNCAKNTPLRLQSTGVALHRNVYCLFWNDKIYHLMLFFVIVSCADRDVVMYGWSGTCIYQSVPCLGCTSLYCDKYTL